MKPGEPIGPNNKFVVCMGILNTVTHILLGGIVTVVTMFGYNISSSDHFRQHIILCVTGYILLMGQGILSLNKQNGWSSSLNFYEKNISHRVVGIIGASLAITGSIIRIQGFGGTSFNSAHSVLGWLALILTCLTFVGGVSSLYIRPSKAIKSAHAIAGCITFSCALMCLCFGLDKTSFRSWISDSVATTMIVFCALAWVGVVIPACISVYNRLKK